MLKAISTRSRGFVTFKAVMSIVALIVGISAIGVAYGMLSSSFLGPAQQEGDATQISELAASMEKKCDAVSEDSGPDDISWSKELKLQSVEDLSIEGGDETYVLRADMEGGEVSTPPELEGCEYKLDGNDIDGPGTYTVEIKGDSGDPSTVTAEVS